MNRKAATRLTLATLASASLMLAGCENMSATQKGTAIGAGAGAGVGAVIGKATGGKAGTGAVVGGAIGAVVGNIWSKKQEERKRQMEQATQGTGIEVARTADNQLKLNVPNDVSFDVNSANIKPELRSVLDTFANSLRDDPNAQLSIIGHTDSTGSDAINNPLSLERARSVRDYLAARGVSASRIETAGRGEREPIADNSTEAGRARNRRVEMYLREPAQQG
ncbi:MAG: OmpA family protein [Rhizobacter sp.]|nr:OmpA family protein [Rhizobacter sp.]